ncbi:MAG: uracil phosphoribosyltransferase [Chitinophagia bacterium]|nr:uracil phosphoribosyltransferase [Chitinophagia bacterium]
MVINLSNQNSLISVWVCELRDMAIQQNREQFRRNLERIGNVAAYEISKKLAYIPQNILTPMGNAACHNLEVQPVIATILRAGLPLYQGILQFFTHADSAFIGAYRKHQLGNDHFEIDQTYITSPEIEGRPLIVADPMLATGASLILALEALLEYDTPSQIHIVSAIACTVGIKAITRKFPQATIWAAAIDDELTAKGYIVPGLGDAGDLAYGSKRQG